MTIAAEEFYHSIPHIRWDAFMDTLAWYQDEHVALIGPTGSGKSTCALNLLRKRRYVTVFATKPQDDTMVRFAAEQGYKVIPQWNHRLSAEKVPRRVLWPDARGLYSERHQAAVFRPALASIYEQGGWCTYIDELWWLTNKLRMGEEVKTFLLQGRSIRLPLMVATQRPAWIPLEVYDQSTHLFFWGDNDETNLSRIASIGSFAAAPIRATIQRLAKYEVLYINTRDRTMYRTMPPPPKENTDKKGADV